MEQIEALFEQLLAILVALFSDWLQSIIDALEGIDG